MEHSTPDYIAAWRSCIQGENKSWVLFEQGTCVILMQPETDLAAQAVALLREFGAVQVGTPSADFNVDYAVGRLGLGGYGASSRYFELSVMFSSLKTTFPNA